MILRLKSIIGALPPLLLAAAFQAALAATPIFEIDRLITELPPENQAPGKDDDWSLEQTIQCRAPFSNFPSSLKSGQRLAVFLDEVPPVNLLVRAVIFLDSMSNPADLSLAWNQNDIYHKKVLADKSIVEAVVLAYSSEKDSNILQIINHGFSQFHIKYLSVTPLDDNLGRIIQMGRAVPEKAAAGQPPIKLYGLGSSQKAFGLFYERGRKSGAKSTQEFFSGLEPAGILHCGKIEGISLLPDKQCGKMKAVLSALIRWFSNCGTSLYLPEYGDGSFFFDDYGQRRASYFAVERFSRVFDGTPARMPFDVIPTSKGTTLDNVEWMAASNGDGVATMILSSEGLSSVNVRVLGAIPWNGKTRLEIFSGFAPEEDKFEKVPVLKKTEEVLDIKPAAGGGVFEKNFSLESCLLVRLSREGAKPPAKFKMPYPVKKKSPRNFKEGVAKVSYAHPPADLLRQPLRYPNGMVVAEGEIQTERVDATRGTIEGVANLAPWDTKSIMLKTAPKKAKNEKRGSARIYISRPDDQMGELSFWVFPKCESSAPQKNSKLLFRCGNVSLSADLKTAQWQRISIPLKGVGEMEYVEVLPPSSSKQTEQKYSYEINGMSAIARQGNGSSIGKTYLKPLGSNNYQLILAGDPFSQFEYYHFTKKPIRPESIVCEPSSIKTRYLEDSQVLVLSGSLPASVSDKLDKSSIPDDFAALIKKGKLSVIRINFSTE